MRTLRIVLYLGLSVYLFIPDNHEIGSAPLPETTLREQLSALARSTSHRTDYHIRRDPSVSFRPESPRSINPTTPLLSAPIPSPGMAVGVTWYDMQHSHSLGKQIARNSGGNHVEMVWNSIVNFDPSENWNITAVMYNAYRISTGTLHPGFGGGEVTIGPPARGNFGNIAVDDQSQSYVTYAQREDITWPRMHCFSFVAAPGSTIVSEYTLDPPGSCNESLWPRLDTQQRNGTEDILHTISESGPTCTGSRLYYWRFDNFAWTGPAIIDSVFSHGYVLVADDHSDNVAILFHDIDEPQANGANNISYYLSSSTGLGFVDGTELGASNKRMLTSYNDTVNGAQAWKYIDAQYDNAGRLHVVWDEQQVANKTANAVIRHWNDERNTIRPVAFGYWAAPAAQNSLNLASLSLAIGDGLTECSTAPGGTNLDQLYLTFTKFTGLTPSEQGDTSAAGFPNGEIYMSISADAGDAWSSPVNLTNTKTPDCNPATPGNECSSEDWGTLNRIVSDIDLLYISDKDAGSAVQGEGTYQPDTVKYLRILGGTPDAEHLCVALTPRFDAFLSENANCEYHAAPGGTQSSEFLTIHNLGAGSLEGTVSILPGAPWLSVTGSSDFTIATGGPSLDYPITMDAASLSEGVYTGIIRVTHNDPERPSPEDYLVKFYVIEDFICSQKVIMSTGVE